MIVLNNLVVHTPERARGDNEWRLRKPSHRLFSDGLRSDAEVEALIASMASAVRTDLGWRAVGGAYAFADPASGSSQGG